MLNLVVLMGRIAHTPEVKKGREKEFTTTSIAVPNGLDEKGEPKVMFVDLVCYGENQKAFDYVNTGDQIAVSGRLDVYKFDKKDGSVGYGTRVIVNNIEFGAPKKEVEEQPKEKPKPEKPSRARR